MSMYPVGKNLRASPHDMHGSLADPCSDYPQPHVLQGELIPTTDMYQLKSCSTMIQFSIWESASLSEALE